MAAGGRNIAVDSYKIFSRIVDKHRHVLNFCDAHPEISYVTLCQLFSGKTKSLRAETVVKLAGALECSPTEIILPQEPKIEKKKVVPFAVQDLIAALEL